jgi:hypothetical protein
MIQSDKFTSALMYNILQQFWWAAAQEGNVTLGHVMFVEDVWPLPYKRLILCASESTESDVMIGQFER